MRHDGRAERWVIQNAEEYPFRDLLEPFTNTFIQQIESDIDGELIVDISPSNEVHTRFVCQLAYLSGWVVTGVFFSGHRIRLQQPSRLENLSKDKWNQPARNERLAPDWNDLSALEDHLDDS